MFKIRLKELREQLGFSQARFARAIGVSQSTVGMWESGKNTPTFSTLESLANYFGVTVDYLLGRTDEPNSVDAAIANFKKDSQNKKAVLMKHGGGGEVLNVTDDQLAIIKEIVERDDSADDWRKAKAILDALKQTNE